MTPEQLLPNYIEKLLTENARKTETRVSLEEGRRLALEAHGNLGAALSQSLPSDDQIILDHVRTAQKDLDTLLNLIGRVLEQERAA